MPNTTLFQTNRGSLVPACDTTNAAGGRAYSMSAKHALAQYAVTGCFTNTFYATAEEQLDKLLDLCKQIETTVRR